MNSNRGTDADVTKYSRFSKVYRIDNIKACKESTNRTVRQTVFSCVAVKLAKNCNSKPKHGPDKTILWSISQLGIKLSSVIIHNSMLQADLSWTPLQIRQTMKFNYRIRRNNCVAHLRTCLSIWSSSLLPLGLGFILSTKSWDYMTLGHTQRHAPDNVCSCGQLKPRHFLIIRKGLSGEKLNVKLSREVLCKITCMSCGRSDGIPVVKHVLCCIKVWRNQNRRGKEKG